MHALPSLLHRIGRPMIVVGLVVPVLLVASPRPAMAAGAASISAVSASPNSIVGGASTTGTVTFTASTKADVVVTLSDTSAATSLPPSVIVRAGTASASFTITTVAVPQDSASTISARTKAGTVTTSLTVRAPAPVGVTLSPAALRGGGISTGTVTLDGAAPAGGVVVAVADDSVAATTPTTVTVAGGTSSATFNVETRPVSAPTTASITATVRSSTVTSSLTVTPARLAGITGSEVIGGAVARGTVLLDGPAGPGGTVVPLRTDEPSVIEPPASVTVPAGASSADFYARTMPVQFDRNAPVWGSDFTKGGFFLVRAARLSSVSVNPTEVEAGSHASGTVALDGAAATDVTIRLSTDSTMVSTPTSVTIKAGASSAAFDVSTNPYTGTKLVTISAVAPSGDGMGWIPDTYVLLATTTLQVLAHYPREPICGPYAC